MFRPFVVSRTQSYEVAASLSVDDEYGEVYEWEGLFQDRMRRKAAEIESLNVAYFTGRSMDDSLAESVSGEIFLFGVTCEFILSLPSCSR